MKNILVLAALFLVSNATFAQIEWQKNYGQPNLNESLLAIFPAFESGHFWAAGVTSSVGQDDFLILKMDSTGQVIWADTLGSPFHNDKIFAFDRNSTTGEMWISGQRLAFNTFDFQPILIKLDANGQKVAEVLNPTSWPTNYGMHSVVTRADGGALAYIGAGGLNAATLRGYSATGSIDLSEPFYDSNGNKPEQSLAVLPDGRFFNVRPFGSFQNANLRTEVSFRTPGNIVIWKKNVQSPTGAGKSRAQNIVADPGDSSVIVSHYEIGSAHFLTKIGADGEVRWQVKTEISENNERLVWAEGGFISLVFKTGLELRNAKTGALISVANFSNGDPNWPKRLRGAAFLPTAKVAMVGDFLTLGSSDGYFGLFNAADYALLDENLIGSAGLPDADDGPFLAEADGHLFVASHAVVDPLKGLDVVLRKLEKATGEVVFETHYGSSKNEIMQAILPLSDGKLLLVAHSVDNAGDFPNDLLLQKIDPTDGSIVWENRQPNPSVAYNARATAMPDGGATVIFQGEVLNPNGPHVLSSQIQALRISATGDLIWRKWIEPTWSSEIVSPNRLIESMILLNDGFLLAVGLESNRSGLVLRINPGTGTAEVVTPLDSVGFGNARRAVSAVQATNGDLLVLSRNYQSSDSLILYRIAPNGAILKRKSIKKNQYHWGSRFFRASDGGLFLLLVYDDSNYLSPGDGIDVLRLTEDFETLAEATIFEKEFRPNDATPLSDGSLAIAGIEKPTNSNDLLVAKTLGLPTVSTTDFLAENGYFSVAPNPLGKSDFLKIELENDFLGLLKIEIWTLDGRLVSGFEKEKTAQKQVFEIENMPAENSFWVRVSDRKASVTRLVFKI
jgi:outer membrane protein assembly factor BamB